MKLNTGHSTTPNIHQWMDQTKKQRKVRKYSKKQKQQFFDELKNTSSNKGLSNELWKFLIAKGYQKIGGEKLDKNSFLIKDEAILSAIQKFQVRVSKEEGFKSSWISYYQTIVSNEFINIIRKTVPTAPIDDSRFTKGDSFTDAFDNSSEYLNELLKFKQSLDNKKFIKNDIRYLLELFEKRMKIKNWQRLTAANRYSAKTRFLREVTNTKEIFSLDHIANSQPIIAKKEAITDDSIMVSENIIPNYIEEKETLPSSLLEFYEIGVYCRKEVDKIKKELVHTTDSDEIEFQKLKLYANALLGIHCLDKVLQYNPQLFISRYNLCMLKRRLGMTDETIHELAAVVQHLDNRPQRPNSNLYKTSTLEFIGEIYMIEKSDPDTALIYFDKATTITATSSEALFNRAICRYSKEKKINPFIIADLKQVYNNKKGTENPESFYNHQMDSSFKRDEFISMIQNSKEIQEFIPSEIIRNIAQPTK